METVTLNITGMTCSGCVNSVRNVLQALPGVNSVAVSLEQGQAVITHDPAHSQPIRFSQVVEDAGFEVVNR